MGNKNLMIRNSTAEFLIFQAQSQADGVEMIKEEKTENVNRRNKGYIPYWA